MGLEGGRSWFLAAKESGEFQETVLLHNPTVTQGLV